MCMNRTTFKLILMNYNDKKLNFAMKTIPASALNETRFWIASHIGVPLTKLYSTALVSSSFSD